MNEFSAVVALKYIFESFVFYICIPDLGISCNYFMQVPSLKKKNGLSQRVLISG